MIRPRVVDTSVLLASVDTGDVHHGKARLMLSEPGPIVVPSEVLVESLGVIGHRLSRAAAKQFLAALRRERWVELGHETPTRDALALQDALPKLSFVDAVGVALARKLGAGLDTFDEVQAGAWRNAVGLAGHQY